MGETATTAMTSRKFMIMADQFATGVRQGHSIASKTTGTWNTKHIARHWTSGALTKATGIRGVKAFLTRSTRPK